MKRLAALVLSLACTNNVNSYIPPPDNSIYVDIQEYNITRNAHGEFRYFIYWEKCDCDKSLHQKVVDWRHFKKELIPIFEKGRYVATFRDCDNKSKKIVSKQFVIRRTSRDPEIDDQDFHDEEYRRGI